MSIDLEIDIANPIIAEEMIERTRDILQKILNTNAIPQITILQVIKGVSVPMCGKALDDDALYQIQYQDIDDIVFITNISHDKYRVATVSVGSTREPTEYLLGLACALAIAIPENAQIRDGFAFWTGHTLLCPSLIISSLAVRDSGMKFEDACYSIVGER